MVKNKTFPLNQNLASATYGIYVATCAMCNQQHVGQTSNEFFVRGLPHRSGWSKQDCKTKWPCRGTIQ